MQDDDHGPQVFERVFHPTDFSKTSEVVFAHGLKIALASHWQLSVLHVGKEAGAPRPHLPKGGDGWTWNRVSVEGAVVETVVDAASGAGTDLVVMTTRGPQEFLGALRGSAASNIIR